MPSVINKATKEYQISVDVDRYPAIYLTGNWIVDPILPTCEKKYWKIVGDSVVEMTAGEKAAVDQAEVDAALAKAEAQKSLDSLNKLVKAFALVTLDQINVLRGKVSLSTLTIDQLKAAVKAKYEAI